MSRLLPLPWRVRRRVLLTGSIGLLLSVVIVAWIAFARVDRETDEQRVPLEGLLARAERALDRNETAAALEILDAILEREPRHGMALLYRGQLIRDQGDPKAALADWRRVPDEPARIGGTARYLEATVLLELHRAREAERLLLRAAALHPTYLQPRERLLELYVAQLRRSDILRQLDQIAKLRPLTLNELVLQATAGERFRPVNEGASLMREFVARDPDDLTSAIALALYRMDADEHVEAADLLRELLGKHADDDRLRGLLAEALLNRRRAEEAHDVLAGRSLTSQSSVWLWRGFGRYWMAIEDWDRAAECFAHVIRLNPDDLGTHYRLGTVLQRAGRKDEARQHLEDARLVDRLHRQAFRIPRGNQSRTDLVAPIVIDVAETLSELRRLEQALEWYRRGVQLNPRDPSAVAGFERVRAELANRAVATAETRGVESIGELDRGLSLPAPPRPVDETSALSFRESSKSPLKCGSASTTARTSPWLSGKGASSSPPMRGW